MSDTTYEPGIYQDVDHDIIKVDADGKTSIIGVGHDGFPFVDLSFATKIADLPRSERPLPAPAEPTLEDGVYRDTDDGEVVLIESGKVVEVLDTGDSCSTESHLPYYQGNSPDLSMLVRVVAPEDDSDSLPTDGFYADKDGDLVQVKGDKMRYIDSGDINDLDAWFGLAEEYANFQPYTPLVEAAAK